VGNLNTPALLFGIILLVASIGLFLFGRVKPELQKDSDSVYAIIGVVCALILFASAFELSLGMSFQQLLMIGTLIALMWENIQARQPKSLAPKRSGGSFDDGRRGGYRDMDDYGRAEPPRDPRSDARRGGYRAEFDDYGRPNPDPRRLREAPFEEDEGRRRPRRDEMDRPVGGGFRDENRPRRPALEDRESRDQRRGSSDWSDEWGPEPTRKPARADAWTEPDRPARPADRPVDRSDRPDRPLDRSLDRVLDGLDGRPADRPVDRPVDRPERSRGSLNATDDLPRRRRPAVDMAPDRPDRPASDRGNSERPIADRTGPSDGDDIAAEFSVRPRRPRVEDRPADRPAEDLPPRRRRPPIGRPDGPDDDATPMPYVDFKPLKSDPDEADNSSNFDD
jgi:hypothetical protein